MPTLKSTRAFSCPPAHSCPSPPLSVHVHRKGSVDDSTLTRTPPHVFDEAISNVIDEYVERMPSTTTPVFVDCARKTPTVGSDESHLLEVSDSILKAWGLSRSAVEWQPPFPLKTTMLLDQTAMFIEDVVDVFYVDSDVANKRAWRTRIDASQPLNLEEFNSTLLQQRAYHARMYYELALSVEVMNSDWISRKPVSMLRDAALVELRSTELRIASYQLSHQVVGIKGGSKDSMYKCALFAWNLHLYMFDELAGLCKHKQGRGEVLTMKPSHADGKRALACLIDTNIHACQAIIVAGMPILLQTKNNEYIYNLGKRMGLTVRSLDDVLIVC